MSEALVCGRRFRTFNVVDDFNREALRIEVDIDQLRPPSAHLRAAQARPRPAAGAAQRQRPCVPGETFIQWAKANAMAIQYIQAGKPNQDAYI